MKYINNKDKGFKLKPIKTLSGLLMASIFTFGAVSCNQQGETEENAVAEEEYTEPLGYETEMVAENDVEGFDRWDVNNDEYLDETEFRTIYSEGAFYDDWDADDDGLLSDNELNEGIFNTYDADNDGILNNEEYDAWNTAWGGDYDYYDAWDVNNDDVLDYDEYYAGIGEAGVYNDWDVDNDGLFSEDEVYDGLYTTWDADADGRIANEEYETIGYNLWGF